MEAQDRIDVTKFFEMVERSKAPAAELAGYLDGIDTAKDYTDSELRAVANEIAYLGKRLPTLVTVAGGVLADLDQAG